MPPTPSPSVAEPVAFADTDIKSASEDRLSRAPFAKRVADLIKGIPQGADSTVIGVIGPWGGGKTSILNLIRAELSQDKAMGLAQFTPWAVGDSNALMVEFFATLLNSHESLSEAKEQAEVSGLWPKS
jgi:predicted KAP-like P-loop ATPase